MSGNCGRPPRQMPASDDGVERHPVRLPQRELRRTQQRGTSARRPARVPPPAVRSPPIPAGGATTTARASRRPPEAQAGRRRGKGKAQPAQQQLAGHGELQSRATPASGTTRARVCDQAEQRPATPSRSRRTVRPRRPGCRRERPRSPARRWPSWAGRRWECETASPPQILARPAVTSSVPASSPAICTMPTASGTNVPKVAQCTRRFPQQKRGALRGRSHRSAADAHHRPGLDELRRRAVSCSEPVRLPRARPLRSERQGRAAAGRSGFRRGAPDNRLTCPRR